jgi:hypothetical protein
VTRGEREEKSIFRKKDQQRSAIYSNQFNLVKGLFQIKKSSTFVGTLSLFLVLVPNFAPFFWIEQNRSTFYKFAPFHFFFCMKPRNKPKIIALALLVLVVTSAVTIEMLHKDGRSFRSPVCTTYTIPNSSFEDAWRTSADGWFRRHLRVSKATFIKLANKLHPYWRFGKGRKGFSLHFYLACFLMFLSSEGEMRCVSAAMGCSTSTVMRCVHFVSGIAKESIQFHEIKI